MPKPHKNQGLRVCGRPVTPAYDTMNNLVANTDRNGHTTRYTFDNLNRLTTGQWLNVQGQPTHTIAFTFYDDHELYPEYPASSSQPSPEKR